MNGPAADASGGALRVAVVYNNDTPTQAVDPSSRSLAALESDAGVIESARAFAAALREAGHDVVLFGVIDDAERVVAQVVEGRFDCVANFVESIGGDSSREPEFAERLERAGVRYTGNGPRALRTTQAKDVVRELLCAAGIRVAPATVITALDGLDSKIETLRWPLFVKPARTDGSIGIDQQSVCRDLESLRTRLAHLASQLAPPWLIEEFLPGRELNVALFPGPDGLAVATELDFSSYAEGLEKIVTYNAKWVEGSPEWSCFSTPEIRGLAPERLEDVLATARRAFVACGGTSYGRVDLRFDRDGLPCVIDVNPNPDLDPAAGFAIAVRSGGIGYVELADTIVRNASLKEPHAVPST